MTEAIEIDYTSEGQRLSWAALLELYDLHPHGWTLIGGQMVHLHCWARGVASPRVTTDADAGLDVRGFPQIAWTLTSTLQEIGFHLTGTSPNGIQHRWVREEAPNAAAQIDVVIPSAVGPRGGSRRTVAGGSMLESFGIQQALDRSDTVDVVLDNVRGKVNRPSLLGGIVGKAAALSNVGDPADRHLEDLLTLCGLLQVADLRTELNRRDRQHLKRALDQLTSQGLMGTASPDQARGIALVAAAVQSYG